MVMVGLVSTLFSRHKAATYALLELLADASLRRWRLAGLVASAIIGMGFPFRPNVFLLGLANGAFAAAAIGAMMRLVNEGNPSRAGIRMGLWGAAQGIAFGAGGLIGALAADVARFFITSQVAAYAVVFAAEGVCSSSSRPCWRIGWRGNRASHAASRNNRRRSRICPVLRSADKGREPCSNKPAAI